MKLTYSIVVPVYNRPDEVAALLASLSNQNGAVPFEVIIVEDGSLKDCKSIVASYQSRLNISYYFTKNQGAGKSRNYGMQKANGDYFIIFDSDCIIPENYIQVIDKKLEEFYTDAFGGPDAAHVSFTNFQKAVNYSMTSWLTTGGIRGKKKSVGRFQPRSFNFGISKEAFKKTKGFSDMKTGEDIDLTFRLWLAGFETQCIEKAFVYHKRRANLQQFYWQVFSFGCTRPLLTKKYPHTAKITYWFPSLFFIGFFTAVLFAVIGQVFVGVLLYLFYFLLLAIQASITSRSLIVGLVSVLTTITQFFAYGLGFLKSSLKLRFMKS